MTRLCPQDMLMCHDGSLEGFLTLVFKAYAMHVWPSDISQVGCVQPSLGQEVMKIPCDITLAERVKLGICNKAGHGTYKKLARAFISCHHGRECDLFAYVVLAMEQGRRGVEDPANGVVAQVEKLSQQVTNELEDMRQFVRFQQLENGVYASTINPKADLVPLLMPHFVARLNTQPFLIYDEVHHVAGVYDMHSTYLVKTEQLNLPAKAAGELEYQQLWKLFYDSLSNEQRFNPDLRRSFMPKRFWRNLTEMCMAVPSASNAGAA